jgi:hypothetical protein
MEMCGSNFTYADESLTERLVNSRNCTHWSVTLKTAWFIRPASHCYLQWLFRYSFRNFMCNPFICSVHWSTAVQKVHSEPMYEGVSKSFRTESITKYTFTVGITRWEATQRFMAANLTRLTHKIAIRLHLVAESCAICSSHSRQPVRKLLDTPSYY